MTLLPADLLLALQARAARGALGASSMRSAGARDAVRAGRGFLCEIDLGGFGSPDPSEFRAALDQTTESLLHAFPEQARHWGLARKGLNIFLRDCLSNTYLREAHGLDAAEPWYELPLDSITGAMLYRVSDGSLPPWGTVRDLTPEVSDAFQAVAATTAGERGIARVHLDALWWGQGGAGGAP
jgi:hypothetical protein